VAEVVAVDLTAEMLEAVERAARERGLANITVRQGAAERLPFPDAHFDMVLCRFSTHHWRDAEAGLREARRVLVPGGRAVFVDIVAAETALLDTHLQAVELLRDPSHVRNYSPAEWLAALARSGFSVSGITRRRLRMEFASWIARTHTPAPHVQAIRSLQEMAAAEIRSHFAIEPDGSFLLDSVSFEAEAA
jgi:ubiquinone/menaquinone biosynthesis C-methylase UbiE